MIFTPNTHFAGADIDVPVAEGYTHNTGVVQAMLENVQNHTAIFNALIGNDFMELHAMHNPDALNESQIEAIYEASTGGFLQKVIEFIKKAWEKIKGFFKSFWDTIRAMLTRDNKELVGKFKSQVLKKDLSKMTYSYRKPTGKQIDVVSVEKADALSKSSASDITKLASMRTEDLQKLREQVGSNETKEKALGLSIGQSSGVSFADYAKESMDYMFEESDKEEGLGSDRLTSIMIELTESSKTLKAIKKNEDDVNKIFKKELAALEKSRKAVNDTIPTKSTSASTFKHGEKEIGTASDNKERTNISLAISTVYSKINTVQTVFNKAIGAHFTNTKFGIKQARAVFLAAVRYNPKAVKESNMLFEHYCDESNYDFDVMVEGVGY